MRVLDFCLAPGTLLAALLLRFLRQRGLTRLPVSRRIFQRLGVLPIVNHYYEPFLDPRSLTQPLSAPRILPGIDMNVSGQLELLTAFAYQEELKQFPLHAAPPGQFFYHNGFFESGDAEFLYSMVRLLKPRRIVEIGSGFSTLIARAAVRRNEELDTRYTCKHVCIEPYEHDWLDKCGAEIIRGQVQHVAESVFQELAPRDILFIDSSHVIRPQGDVLHEYLRILPSLTEGVVVHIHDIFTPRDYPESWVVQECKLWNEQYLVEALLSCSNQFTVLGALNYLAEEHRSKLAECFPVYAREADQRQPGSFWIARGKASTGIS